MPQLPTKYTINKEDSYKFNKNIFSNYYPGFSLVEMLVVIAITIILFAVTGSAFTGIRNSIALNEDVRLIAQDISWAQRSSMTLRRESGEYWIHGIGVDLSKLESGEYTIFKWCSAYPEYDPSIAKLSGELPNFDSKSAIGIGNGNLPVISFGSSNASKPCSVTTQNQLVPVSGRGVTNFNNIVKVSTESTSSKTPKYLLFESVTGRAFVYDGQGNLLNYTLNAGNLEIIEKQIPVAISLKAGNFTKDIVVYPVSGQITVMDDYVGDVIGPKPIDDEIITPPGGDESKEEIPKDEPTLPDPIKQDPIILDPVKGPLL